MTLYDDWAQDAAAEFIERQRALAEEAAEYAPYDPAPTADELAFDEWAESIDANADLVEAERAYLRDLSEFTDEDLAQAEAALVRDEQEGRA